MLDLKAQVHVYIKYRLTRQKVTSYLYLKLILTILVRQHHSVFEVVFINESLSNRANIIKITEQTPVPKDIQVMSCLIYLVLY